MENDWWKWGEAAKRKQLTHYPKLKAHFEERFQTRFDKITAAPLFPVDTAEINEAVERLKRQFPYLQLKTDVLSRLKKASGKSYPDLLSAFFTDKIHLPDAVIYPSSQGDIKQVLQWASEQKVAIVPFGGGSNVVGAFKQKDESALKVVLDMSNLSRLLSLDKENLTAEFEAGIYGPQLEAILNKEGFTMGHFPQSFEFSTLGGWIVTRSAGQESSHYGRIDDIVISIKALTPQGEINTSAYESDAEGVNLKSLFLGSEGMFGVITQAKVHIHPLPEAKKWVTAVFPTFEHGTKAMKELVQREFFPAVVRYSDEEETFFLSLLSHEAPTTFSKLKSNIVQSVLKSRGIEKPSIMMLRFDGSKEATHVKAEAAKSIIKNHKGFLSGESLGKKWESSRFGLPYLRDDLLERGIFVDTMETILPWNKIENMKQDLLERLQQSTAFGKEKGILLAHLSHVYTTASSIYFTIITKQDKVQAFEQWQEIKTIVTNAIVEHGGAVSHHHSIGRDHQKWYLKKTDLLTQAVLQAVKKTLDPNGILNPGKLFDE